GYIIFDAPKMKLFMPSCFPAVEAATLGDLAAKFSLDPAALNETVSKFNAAVRPGSFDHTTLDDCRTEGLTPNKTHWAQKIDTPPSWAYPLRAGTTVTYLGSQSDSPTGG